MPRAPRNLDPALVQVVVLVVVVVDQVAGAPAVDHC